MVFAIVREADPPEIRRAGIEGAEGCLMPICRYCGKEFEGYHRRVACDDPECQAKHEERTKEIHRKGQRDYYQKHHRPIREYKKRNSKSPYLAPTRSGRRCLRCGKDPSPNYFYCNQCHPFAMQQEGLNDTADAGGIRWAI